MLFVKKKQHTPLFKLNSQALQYLCSLILRYKILNFEIQENRSLTRL